MPYRMIVRAFDGPSALEREDFEPEAPGPKQVSLRVTAIGCNFFDALITAGQYQRRPELPFAPGAEIAGEVVAVGEGSAWKVGERVMALVDYGAYASHLNVEDERVYAFPEGLNDDQASAFGIVYQTSYFGLVYRAALQPGETALIHAAAGGVGLAAVQIAKALGARVIATAGSDAKLALAAEHGADVCIGYRDANWIGQVKEATDGRGADVIYDPVGGDIFDGSTKCIAWDGRLVVVGFASGRIPTLQMNRVLLKNIAVTGLHWGAYYDHDRAKIRDAHEALCKMVAAGQLSPVVTQTAPLEDAARVIGDLHSRKTRGKVVLHP
ncbi:MAG: NADPH:quinone oxidoreductase family protein [Myxococcota bacterium]